MRISIALLILCVSGPALAQPDGVERAKKHFEVAELHFQDGEYAQAIEQYRKAHALSKEPLLLFNIGLCLEKQGKPVEAIASYRAYLAADPEGAKAGEAGYRVEKLDEEAKTSTDKPPPPPEDRQPAAPPTLTLRLARDIGTLKLSVVALGGKELDCPPTTFVTPCVLTDVPRGPARLAASKDGNDATTTFEAPGGGAVRRIDYTPSKPGYRRVFLYSGIAAGVAATAGFVGAGLSGTQSGAFAPLMATSVLLAAGTFVTIAMWAGGIGGDTVPASVSVR